MAEVEIPNGARLCEAQRRKSRRTLTIVPEIHYRENFFTRWLI